MFQQKEWNPGEGIQNLGDATGRFDLDPRLFCMMNMMMGMIVMVMVKMMIMMIADADADATGGFDPHLVTVVENCFIILFWLFHKRIVIIDLWE